jgi:hypothetical protein
VPILADTKFAGRMTKLSGEEDERIEQSRNLPNPVKSGGVVKSYGKNRNGNKRRQTPAYWFKKEQPLVKPGSFDRSAENILHHRFGHSIQLVIKQKQQHHHSHTTRRYHAINSKAKHET